MSIGRSSNQHCFAAPSSRPGWAILAPDTWQGTGTSNQSQWRSNGARILPCESECLVRWPSTRSDQPITRGTRTYWQQGIVRFSTLGPPGPFNCTTQTSIYARSRRSLMRFRRPQLEITPPGATVHARPLPTVAAHPPIRRHPADMPAITWCLAMAHSHWPGTCLIRPIRRGPPWSHAPRRLGLLLGRSPCRG